MAKHGTISCRDFLWLLQNAGWVKRSQNGSHQKWYKPKVGLIIVDCNHGQAKKYQVDSFLKIGGE